MLVNIPTCPVCQRQPATVVLDSGRKICPACFYGNVTTNCAEGAHETGSLLRDRKGAAVARCGGYVDPDRNKTSRPCVCHCHKRRVPSVGQPSGRAATRPATRPTR